MSISIAKDSFSSLVRNPDFVSNVDYGNYSPGSSDSSGWTELFLDIAFQSPDAFAIIYGIPALIIGMLFLLTCLIITDLKEPRRPHFIS